MDWQGCDLVEEIPGKQGGAPLVKGTRVPAQQILEEFQLGSSIAEIERNYPSLTEAQIRALIAFDKDHKAQPVP
jgi:uncharacterized protein (DUF433 family)